jgi:hypothetical protein
MAAKGACYEIAAYKRLPTQLSWPEENLCLSEW